MDVRTMFSRTQSANMLHWQALGLFEQVLHTSPRLKRFSPLSFSRSLFSTISRLASPHPTSLNAKLSPELFYFKIGEKTKERGIITVLPERGKIKWSFFFSFFFLKLQNSILKPSTTIDANW